MGALPTPVPEIHIINRMRSNIFNLPISKRLRALSSLCFPSPFPLLQPKGAHLEEIQPLLAWLEGAGPAELLELLLPLEHGK